MQWNEGRDDTQESTISERVLLGSLSGVVLLLLAATAAAAAA